MISSQTFTYRAFVTTVIDGDTIVADVDLGFGVCMRDQRFRLLGINAPELRGPSKAAGQAASQVLKALIEDKWIILKTHKDSKEKWGRWLAEAWLNDDCINERMINEGHAVRYSS
jgi:micrococcal nuclease